MSAAAAIRKRRLALGALSVGWVALVVGLLVADWSASVDWVSALVLVAIIVANVRSVSYDGMLFGLGFVWAIFAAVVVGPGPAAAIVIAAELITYAIDRVRPVALQLNILCGALPTYSAGLVFGAPGVGSDELGVVLLVSVCAIALLEYFASMLVGVVLLAWYDGRSPWRRLRIAPLHGVVALYSLPVLVGALVVEVEVGTGATAMFVLSLIGFAQMQALLVQSRQRAAQIAELAASRQRLVAQAMQAEEHERRRLAERLHDDAIQNLVVAAQELEEAEPEARGRAQEAVERAITDLREAVFDLHPVVLTQAGLRAALEEVVERHTRRGGAAVALTVDQGAEGADDPLLFSMARELLTNAVKHSHASRVQLTVRRCGEDIELEVVDDGIGIPAGRLESAVRKGHIGLASMRERVEVLGGSLEIDSREEEGTRVKAVVLANASLADPEPEPELGKVRARWLRRIRSRAAT